MSVDAEKRSQFIRHLIHDMRSPLSTIVALTSYTQSLCKSAPEDVLNALDEIKCAANVMDEMLEVVGFLNRVEYEAPSLKFESRDIRAIVERALAGLDVHLARHEMRTSLELSEQVILADVELLEASIKAMVRVAAIFASPKSKIHFSNSPVERGSGLAGTTITFKPFAGSLQGQHLTQPAKWVLVKSFATKVAELHEGYTIEDMSGELVHYSILIPHSPGETQ